MKKIKLLFISLFVLGVTMFSCKVVDVEDVNLTTNEKDSKALNRARISYEERLKNDPTLKKFNIKPMWNSNSVVTSKNTIELPFTIDDKFRLPFIEGNKDIVGRERLVFIEKGSKFIPYIVRYMPTKLFKGDIKKISTVNAKKNNFDGIISVRTLDKTGVTILHFANGKMYKKFKGKLISDKNKKGRITGWIYREPWVTLSWDGHEVVFNYHDGMLVQTNDENNNGNDDDDDPSFCDEHPEICSNEDPCVIDPSSCGDPCLADPTACNSGGGSYTNDIKNEIQTPCLKGQVNNLITKNIGSDIVGRFNSLFGKNETRPFITFTERNAGMNAASARCNKTGPGSYELWLNKDILPNASQEYLATVVIHEILHALMYENGVAAGLQHDAMLVAFITEMTFSVQGVFPNLSNNDARSMVLAGLYNDPNVDKVFWQNTANSFGLTIENVFSTNDKYKGFDNQSFLGNHCN